MIPKQNSKLGVVEVAEIPDYPISSNDRLDSHFFLQWNLKRWRGSEFRKKADPDVGWYGFQLFCIAQDGSPIGTLPSDDVQLAFDLNLPLEKWRSLLERKINPLHGWSRVQCDNGEIRLAHSIVTLVAQEALKSKYQNAAAAATRRRNKRVFDLREMIERIGSKQLLNNPHFVERFNDWLELHYENVQRREQMIKAALSEFVMEVAP